MSRPGVAPSQAGPAGYGSHIDLIHLSGSQPTCGYVLESRWHDVPQLRVGVYTVTASASGFSKAVGEKITVSVGNRQCIDLTLRVGGAETTVEVTDVAIQLETESSQPDQTITNYQNRSTAAGQPQLLRPPRAGDGGTPSAERGDNIQQRE